MRQKQTIKRRTGNGRELCSQTAKTRWREEPSLRGVTKSRRVRPDKLWKIAMTTRINQVFPAF